MQGGSARRGKGLAGCQTCYITASRSHKRIISHGLEQEQKTWVQWLASKTCYAIYYITGSPSHNRATSPFFPSLRGTNMSPRGWAYTIESLPLPSPHLGGTNMSPRGWKQNVCLSFESLVTDVKVHNHACNSLNLPLYYKEETDSLPCV